MRERILFSLGLNLIDKNLKLVDTVNTSNWNWNWSIKTIGDEIWCCHSDGISVYDDTLHPLRQLKLGPTHDTALLSQGHNVIAGEDGLRIVLESGKTNANRAITYSTCII